MSASHHSSPTSPPATREAPRPLGGILRELGPGLIIAGSVVGYGELIATTISWICNTSAEPPKMLPPL